MEMFVLSFPDGWVQAEMGTRTKGERKREKLIKQNVIKMNSYVYSLARISVYHETYFCY